MVMMEVYLSICARVAAEYADLLPITDCGAPPFPLHLTMAVIAQANQTLVSEVQLKGLLD